MKKGFKQLIAEGAAYHLADIPMNDLRALYTGLSFVHAAVYISATYHNSHLNTNMSNHFDLTGILFQHLRGYSEIAVSHQRLS